MFVTEPSRSSWRVHDVPAFAEYDRSAL